MAIGWMRGRRSVVLLSEARYVASGDGTMFDPRGVGDFTYQYAIDPARLETSGPVLTGNSVLHAGANVVHDGDRVIHSG